MTTSTSSAAANYCASVALTGLSEPELLQLSKDKLLSLSLEEMKAVQAHFASIKREPTDVELETIAQTWSEHCKHKTFKGVIDYRCEVAADPCPSRVYDDLLNQTVVKATRDLNKNWCLSVFVDNAGVIDFDAKDAVAFKVETHNHPSALEPYGGAGTGLGGVIRDILGVGLGAKPILNTDVFCVGEFGKNPGASEKMLPPERILSGVISGVRDYGNRMGIPTANGAIFFDEGFYANPLVFCGTVGLLPKDKIDKTVLAGDLVVAIGGRTGRDGIHGATFSSLALEAGISSSVVQIGHAIAEKKTADALLRARDQKLYRALTDCGAGGFSSAIGELSEHCGVKVHLERAPLKYAGLSPWEIWLSESQERMVLVVPPENLSAFEAICKTENVECAVLGEFTNTGRLEAFYQGQKVADLDLQFLHGGLPRVYKTARWKVQPEPSQIAEFKIRASQIEGLVKKLLAHPNIASKKWVVRQYDHEVQGGGIVKPFAGAQESGPNDAAVFRPKLTSWKGIVVGNGFNPHYGKIDPYWMAANAIDEALRNVAAVGGDVDHCAILDNFCWGNVHDPDILGGLVRASQGAHDLALAFGTPFISGKDSLNNTWRTRKNAVISIPGVLLISAISVIGDVRQALTSAFKKPGNKILLLGQTSREFGGSHLHAVLGQSGGVVPKVHATTALKMMRKIFSAAQKDWIAACHDISEGGLAVALAEMAMGANLGASISVRGDAIVDLFSESASRWVLEVSAQNLAAVQKHFAGLPLEVLGEVQKTPTLKIADDGKTICKLPVAALLKSWNAFSEKQ